MDFYSIGLRETNILSRFFLLCAGYRTTTSRGFIGACWQSCIDRARLMRFLAGKLRALHSRTVRALLQLRILSFALLQDRDAGGRRHP
jgi:hypothetical protein